MIREKVEAQQSAGVTTAKRRRADRTSVDGALDETDKEIARTLLGKKKKKRKAVPFYRKGWFTLLGVAVLLLALSYVGYLAFIKVPSPESYVERAQKLLKSAAFSERKEGRELLDEFFQYYPEHLQSAAMHALADRYDLEQTERQMLNRRARFSPEGEAETLARSALDNEDLGRLREARDGWQRLAQYEAKKGEDHAWGLVAKKYLSDMQAVEPTFRALQKRLEYEKAIEKKLEPKDPMEKQALQAMRNESIVAWNDLKTQLKEDSDNRRWYLMAAWQYRELSEKQK